MERRLLARNKVSTTVYLATSGANSIRCLATNLSTMGVFVQISTLGLRAGTEVSLVFAVDLGHTVRLHRREAVITHVAERGAGLLMREHSRVCVAAQEQLNGKASD